MLKKIIGISSISLISLCHAVPSIVGDIIARDLSGAGPLGHIGVLSAPNVNFKPTVVLEAMDSAPHIQENSIDDFKSRTKLWGSKGGLLSPGSLEAFGVANSIVRQYYACPEYTITWRWKQGYIDGNSRPISCGQFRCDTLVNFAYTQGDRMLPTYNTITTTPVAIWNYFPQMKETFLPEEHRAHSDFVSNDSNLNASSVNEHNIKEMNYDDFYKMLQNSQDISDDQIIYLWKLVISSEIDENIRILFYDFISFENPTYLTTEIIKQARLEKGEARHKLLVILQAIYQESLGNNETENLKEIIEYFRELQHEELDKSDSGIVYRGLATLSKHPLNINKANLTNMDRIHVDIFMLKNDRINEIKYIRDIIKNLDNPDDRLVVSASYLYLTNLLISSDLKLFSSEGKKLFKEHLEKKTINAPNQSLLYTPAYLEFKAALNARKVEDIPLLPYDFPK